MTGVIAWAVIVGTSGLFTVFMSGSGSPCLLSGDCGSFKGLLTRSVISARGTVGDCGSGDLEGAGVGRGGTAGIVEGLRLPRIGTALFRLGDDRFEGEVGSTVGAMPVSGSKISEGSMVSPVFARRPPRVVFRGEASMLAVVCLRVFFRGLLLGAGVKSSWSCGTIVLCSTISSSDSSSTTALRVVLRGLVGDAIIATVTDHLQVCRVSSARTKS